MSCSTKVKPPKDDERSVSPASSDDTVATPIAGGGAVASGFAEDFAQVPDSKLKNQDPSEKSLESFLVRLSRVLPTQQFQPVEEEMAIKVEEETLAPPLGLLSRSAQDILGNQRAGGGARTGQSRRLYAGPNCLGALKPEAKLPWRP